MSKFHLSYDLITQTSEYSNEEILIKIVDLIENNLNSTQISRPVESTLVFNSNNSFTNIKNLIDSLFNNDIYFVLSQVAKTEDETKIIYTRKNTLLNISFKSKYLKK